MGLGRFTLTLHHPFGLDSLDFSFVAVKTTCYIISGVLDVLIADVTGEFTPYRLNEVTFPANSHVNMLGLTRHIYPNTCMQ